MLINAELLLQYQRCKRRAFLDINSSTEKRDASGDLLRKLQQDKAVHQKKILTQWNYQQPGYSRKKNYGAAKTETLDMMHQGVDCIHKGLLVASYGKQNTLISRPDLLLKRPGRSRFGNWFYVPANIELGKRPKQEYQVAIAFHTQILAVLQGVFPPEALLMLRGREIPYAVDLVKRVPQMRQILDECIQTLQTPTPPDLFISRQKCSLCHWHSNCYKVAKSDRHLSLLPGVTPVRYLQLQEMNITTPESLANTDPNLLTDLPGFDCEVAPKLVLQAKSTVENRPLILPLPSRTQVQEYSVNTDINISPELVLARGSLIEPSKKITTQKVLSNNLNPNNPNQLFIEDIISTAPVELYFDIEAQPDLNLNYLLGVLVVDNINKSEKFYSLLAETPQDEDLVWQQFLDLVWQYPDAPIYHFCVYEFDTVKRLAKLYRTPSRLVKPVLNRFVDIYEQLIGSVTLPIESYALKAIARWLNFEWRDVEASGAKCIYWYDQWLKTGDRTLLDIIQRYNEDDCRATRSVKVWLINFLQEQYFGIEQNVYDIGER
ncbi:MAG: TM0106 family RecB-like putative nuclease [Cyanobacteria bacterium P01_A01_bin.84]